MKQVELYVCDYCKTQYSSPAAACECEANHKKPVRILEVQFQPIGMNRTGYPTYITVELSDGSRQKFRRQSQ